jgi:hypothetical protein
MGLEGLDTGLFVGDSRLPGLAGEHDDADVTDLAQRRVEGGQRVFALPGQDAAKPAGKSCSKGFGGRGNEGLAAIHQHGTARRIELEELRAFRSEMVGDGDCRCSASFATAHNEPVVDGDAFKRQLGLRIDCASPHGGLDFKGNIGQPTCRGEGRQHDVFAIDSDTFAVKVRDFER